MRLNKFVAQSSGLSRRAADAAIEQGRVSINGKLALVGQTANDGDQVRLDEVLLTLPEQPLTIMLHKPVGYVVSRHGQGSKTIYDLLPKEYQKLKPIGRIDKDSSGLVLLTSDGDLANQLTHPRYAKQKIYQVTLDKVLQPLHQQMISDHGINLADGPSKFQISSLDGISNGYEVGMQEGRNRQIRRTFEVLGYKVMTLHRTQFGQYNLNDLESGKFKLVLGSD